MLKATYDYLGFFGSLSISLLIFTLFVFWIAGIAGITLPVDGGRKKYNTWQVVLAVLIPVYPIFWMGKDIIEQHIFMKNN